MKQIIAAIVVIMFVSCVEKRNDGHDSHGRHFGKCVSAFAAWGVNAVEVDDLDIVQPYNVLIPYHPIEELPNGMNASNRGMAAMSGSIIEVEHEHDGTLNHEIGHALGFPHSSDPNDLMYRYYDPSRRAIPSEAEFLLAYIQYQDVTFRCQVIH